MFKIGIGLIVGIVVGVIGFFVWFILQYYKNL